MTATFSSPLSPEVPHPLFSQWKATLLEPLLVVAVSLFWITVLPFTAFFCVGMAIYDMVAGFKSPEIRLPSLGRNLATNPLVLRRKCAPGSKATNQPGVATRSAHA